MAEVLGVDEKTFRKRFAHRRFGRWTLNEIKRGRGRYDCVFLRWDSEGRSLCSVYAARPTQCRTWPFWPGNLESPAAWDEAARGCPGMREGGNFVSVEKIRILLDRNPEGL